MDPNQSIISMQPVYPAVYPALFPGIFNTMQDGQDYLSSLDSDTRDYVTKHTSEFSSKEDLIECVNKLHGES